MTSEHSENWIYDFSAFRKLDLSVLNYEMALQNYWFTIKWTLKFFGLLSIMIPQRTTQTFGGKFETPLTYGRAESNGEL